MDIKPITADFCELKKVRELAKEAFPPEEYLSPDELIKMAQNGEIDFWALYEKMDFVGFMAVRIYEEISYLFFLAIDPEHRSGGCGSRALKLLKEIYPGKQQVVDFEKLDNAAENNEQRKKRRSFYLRNGYKETGKFVSYFGVQYEIFCTEENFAFASFQGMMKSLKIPGLVPEYFEK